ncbi:MAG: UvrD-helicase domain-containing protein, partial [Candidatus Methanomethylophilaceae archaeon]|nr:UvrD-helicase domain-containing protein [Candidatus Methanomethylophilaceae archaeon]
MKDKDIKLNQRLADACSHLSSYTENPGFVEPMDFKSILKDYRQLKNDVDYRSSKLTYSLGFVNKTLKSNISRFQEMYDSFPQTMAVHNDQIAQRLADDIGNRINPVEGRDLDKQQLTAIAYDVRTRLVIAGAGTGKTTTIIGLVKYLFSSGKANPEEVLLLSFTNASVNELKERIQNETGQRVEITTFHRLGLKIIAEAQGKVPLISKIDISSFITEEILRRKNDPVFMRKLNEYIAYDYESLRDEDQFESGSEMIAYLQENP